jgi:hypothetical protein
VTFLRLLSRKLFEVQPHRSCDIFGIGAGSGHAHSNEFPDMAHLAGRKNGLLGYLEAKQAGYGADGFDAAQIRRRKDDIAMALGYMDGCYPGMRQRAARKQRPVNPGSGNRPRHAGA